MRAEPNRFLVYRLNHSATTARQTFSAVSRTNDQVLRTIFIRQNDSLENAPNYFVFLRRIQSRVVRLNGQNRPLNSRSRQGSNLCGQSPIDFKSIALTTRPRLRQ